MANRLLPLATLAFAAVYFYLTAYHIRVRDFGDPVGPRMFPFLLCVGLVLAAAMLFYENHIARGTVDGDEPERAPMMPLVIAGIVVLSMIYFAVFETAGYVVSTSVYLLALTSYFHKGKHLVNLSTSVLVPLVTYLLFVDVLDVSLPAGILPF